MEWIDLLQSVYRPHKDDVYTLLSDLEHTLAYIQQTITRLQEQFPHIYKSKTQQWAEKEINHQE